MTACLAVERMTPWSSVNARLPGMRPCHHDGECISRALQGGVVGPMCRLQRLRAPVEPGSGCEEASALYCKGCLWNTMVLVVRTTALLEFFARLTPTLMNLFESIKGTLASPEGAGVLQKVYAELSPVNFSQAILAPTPHRLGVVRVRGVYWSDWGDPTRLRQDLAHFGLRATLV
jgi:hypothetical protein